MHKHSLKLSATRCQTSIYTSMQYKDFNNKGWFIIVGKNSMFKLKLFVGVLEVEV